MIGNDIVDLALAKRESNWRRRGYLDKIFTLYEQQLIHNASDPDQLVWLLWSMKESVYKLVVRQTHDRVFAPAKIACDLPNYPSGPREGTVFYHAAYRTKSVITSQYISTVAVAANTMSAYTQVIVSFETTDYQTHQRQIREQVRQHSAQLFDTSEREIFISKDTSGAPLLTIGKSVPIPLSISHHGLHGAFTIGSVPLSSTIDV